MIQLLNVALNKHLFSALCITSLNGSVVKYLSFMQTVPKSLASIVCFYLITTFGIGCVYMQHLSNIELIFLISYGQSTLFQYSSVALNLCYVYVCL